MILDFLVLEYNITRLSTQKRALGLTVFRGVGINLEVVRLGREGAWQLS